MKFASLASSVLCCQLGGRAEAASRMGGSSSGLQMRREGDNRVAACELVGNICLLLLVRWRECFQSELPPIGRGASGGMGWREREGNC
jgi:hypothetical protein